MNASYEWLRDFVRFKLTPEELRDLLTSRAATVDELVRLRSDLSEIVIGRVVEAARHPDSDHLWVTKVDAGGTELLDVVCGAPNVVVGAVYPFAPVGSTLPGGLRLEKRRIRGAVSQGMLCSARELRLGSDHEGIMELDVVAAPGTRFLDVVAVGDTQLVVDVLPNRPDLLSHQGLAREIAAALGVPLELPAIPGATASRETVSDGPAPSVTVEDTEGCPRYMAAVIRGVKVAPSPPWLSARIEAVGGRSINNVVDATNYMLHGFGQPMHAFDLSRLDGSRIIVRRASPNEKIRTLDGVDRVLDTEMTVIADAKKPQAIAGVIGGEGSEVTDATTDILLEVASFDARRVRATRRKLGVSTDASYRFERGVDTTALRGLLAYAAELIVSVAGGSVSAAADVNAGVSPMPAVHLRMARAATLLGENLEVVEIRSLLESVGFSVATEDPAGTLEVTPPGWRNDVTGEAEVVEEIARLHGYDRFSSELRPFRPGTVREAPLHRTMDRVRRACVAAGLYEIRPMPFTNRSDERSLRVRNPLAEDEAFLRQDVLDTLARRAEFNLAHMQRNVRLFEIGAVFARGSSNEPGALPDESLHVAALVMGDRRPAHFSEPRPPHFDEWDAEGIAEAIGEAAFPGHRIGCVPSGGDALWSVTAGDVKVGTVRRLSLDAPAWAAPALGIEIDLQALGATVFAQPSAGNQIATSAQSGLHPRYAAVASMPAIQVDLALIVPDTRPASDVERVIRDSAGDLLEQLVLFDEFRGPGIPEGSRSLAWALTFRHPERTLRDREIQGRTAKIVKTLEAELGVRQRTA